MNATIIILRVLHILCGVYWVGTVFFIAQYFEPIVRGMGPAGAPIIQGLQARGYFSKMPIIAVITVLSGVGLLYIDSSGFSAAWMSSLTGVGLSIGALFGVAGLGVGLSVMRPTTVRMAKLNQEAQSIPDGPARAAHLAPMAGLRNRITIASRWTAALLLVAVVAMSVSRYLV